MIAGWPLLGYAVAAAAWLAQWGIELAANRRAARALAERERRTALGVLGAATLSRVWLVTLAILLVGLLGGRVWVESEVGHGSTFYLLVPRVHEPAIAEDVADPRPRLLIADRLPQRREVLRDAFRDSAFLAVATSPADITAASVAALQPAAAIVDAAGVAPAALEALRAAAVPLVSVSSADEAPGEQLVTETYRAVLRTSFIPEWVSMNAMMAGMFPTMVAIMMGRDMRAMDPHEPLYWGTMALAIGVGFVTAYPVNWWLVSRGLKHGLMTVRPAATSGPVPPGADGRHGPAEPAQPAGAAHAHGAPVGM